MSIQIICPAGHTLRIADAWAGRAGRCPVCKALVEVPTAQGNEQRIEILEEATLEIRRQSGLSASAMCEAPSSVEAGGLLEKAQRCDEPTAPAVPPCTPPPLPGTPFVAVGETVPDTFFSAVDTLSREAVDSVAAEMGQAPKVEDDESKVLREPPPIRAASPPAIEAVVDTKPDVVPSMPIAPPAATSAGSEAPTELTSKPTREPVSWPPRIGYRPDTDKLYTVYYLAAAMTAFSLFTLAPALAHWNLGAAPDWARAIWLLSILQLAYVAWVVSIPDWTTLWSSMIVFTIVAALYGLVMTVALTTPLTEALPLDLTDVRRQAVMWCAGVVLLGFLLAYGCGRAAWRWRRTFELLHA
jgi:hypothetical protein